MDFRGDELALIKSDDYREHVRGYSRDHLKNPLVVGKNKLLESIERGLVE